MSSFFARLPIELQTKVLQTVLDYAGAVSLAYLIHAFQELSSLVLVISDDGTSPLPSIPAVQLEDHAQISQLKRTKPITMLSFNRCDEEAGIGRLTRSGNCDYGRYIDPQTAVFVLLHGKCLFGRMFIEQLVKAKGCSGKQLAIHHDSRHKSKAGHVEIVRPRPYLYKNRRLFRYNGMELVWEFIGARYCVLSDLDIPSMINLCPLIWKRSRFVCWRNITDVSCQEMRYIKNLTMPHLKRLKVSNTSVPSRCCEVACFSGLAYNPKKLTHVYFEFKSHRVPIIVLTPWRYTCSKITTAESFSFINLGWCEADPMLSSHLCAQAIENWKDYTEWSEYPTNRQSAMTFLDVFKEITLIGVPDYLLVGSRFTNMKKLVWKRLIPSNLNVDAVQNTIHCPSLKNLDVATLLRSDHADRSMPRIHAPLLKQMELCAVNDSDIPWDLPFHFTTETLASVRHVYMDFKGTSGPSITLGDLTPLADNLESLSVKGCYPSFVVDSYHSDVGAAFPNLSTLEFDMGYLHLETINGQPRPLATVFFDRDTFPVLNHILLDTQCSGRSYSQLCHCLCNVKIQVSSSCQLLSVAVPLSGNNFLVIKEGEERCQGVQIQSQDFHETGDRPGWVTVGLEARK